jgi:hypothetical protein
VGGDSPKMNNGWIKLYRKTLQNPVVMKDANHLAVWVYLLMNATHDDLDVVFEGKRITMRPGQFITGRKKIARALLLTESRVQRILKTLEIEHQIEQQTTPRCRLISIVNWDVYQQSKQPNEQQVNNKRTTSEQQVNTKQECIKNERTKEEAPPIPPHTDDPTIEYSLDEKTRGALSYLNKLLSSTYTTTGIYNSSVVDHLAKVFIDYGKDGLIFILDGLSVMSGLQINNPRFVYKYIEVRKDKLEGIKSGDLDQTGKKKQSDKLKRPFNIPPKFTKPITRKDMDGNISRWWINPDPLNGGKFEAIREDNLYITQISKQSIQEAMQ